MMAANKVAGIRCGVCSDTFSARMIRQHNDANMLALGARVVGEGLALEIVDAFLAAEFEGGRHAARVAMIEGGSGQTHLPELGFPAFYAVVAVAGQQQVIWSDQDHAFEVAADRGLHIG